MSKPPVDRARTSVDAIAEAHFDAFLHLSPLKATELGVSVGQDDWDDLSPAGLEGKAELARTTLSELARAVPSDEVDKVTISAMRERLELELERHAASLDAAEMNNIHSPVQQLRDAIDLMPTETDDDWARIGARLQRVPRALEEYASSLRQADSHGVRAARRQVQACIKQAEQFTAPEGYFASFLAGSPASGSARSELEKGVAAAARGYRELGDWLKNEWIASAPEADAVGRERYQLESRVFLGSQIDLEQTYAWGHEELARITGLMEQTAEAVKPGASVHEAIGILDADPRYRLDGTDALRAWMQQQADAAVDSLADVHFDIPDPVRRLECMIAPTQTGGIYYTPPSEDFSRPGRMWWSVPPGVTRFGTWRELTTVFHEGVPGHHLQLGQTTYRANLLNKWRRMGCWVSGHGEGWALYSEWLMADLGYMSDPGNRLGLLDGQSMRAARVVVDIGFHCGFEAPAEVGGGEWTYDKAWSFLKNHVNMNDGFLKFELDRYLGWAGQAPSYKLGEKLWLELRDECRRREGDAFDLKAFHRRALDIGSVGLDTLRQAVLGEL